MNDRLTNVLVVEDSRLDASLLVKMLQAGGAYDAVARDTLADAESALTEKAHAVVICDLNLPDSAGIDTFKRLRVVAPHSAILIISGTADQDLAMSAVRDGAQDYLVKGTFDAVTLRRAVRHALERHRLQTALMESEAHYRHLLAAITDYTYRVELRDGEVVSTTHSATCLGVTGYAPSEYDADPGLWLRMVFPEDHPAVLDQAARVRRGEIMRPLEHRILHRDGALRWVRNTVVPQRDEDGKVVAYDGLIRDITARKLAEEKLVRSEAFYHSLVETLPQHILRKDLNECFTFANQRFCHLVGRKLEELVGKTDFDFFPADLARKYQADDRAVIRSGQVFETEEVNQAPGGELRYVNVIKTPIHDPSGRIIGIQGIFWDITGRRKAEQELRRAHEDLSRSHAELKAAQLQLIQAAKMESIGTLAAGVAHEVKNPLATLVMGLNFLDRSLPAKDENTTLVLNEMRDAIGRADKVARDLLEFAAGRQLDVRTEDLNALIERTLVLLRHEFKLHNIELVTRFAPTLPKVAIEKNQIQQVLVNVLMNALQAMGREGCVSITTFSERLAQSLHTEGSRTSEQFFLGDVVVGVHIDDTGPGIPSEHLAKIFDPFFTTKPTGVGTGLGLPVSRKIVELHGGAIEIKNRPEGGARVTILLRAEKSHEKESPAGG